MPIITRRIRAVSIKVISARSLIPLRTSRRRRPPAPTNRMTIRPGFMCLQSTDKVTSKLTDSVKFEQPFFVDGASGPRKTHGNCAPANNRCFVKRGDKWTNEILERKLCMGRCGASSLAASIPRDSWTIEFVGVEMHTELRKLRQPGIHRCHVASGKILRVWEKLRKVLLNKMSRPSTSSMEDGKRLGRDLLGRPSLALK